MKSIYLFGLVFLVFCSCTKNTGSDQSLEDGQKKRAEDFTTFLLDGTFRLTAFYSDKPVDYDESDTVVMQETELWAYVRPYVQDDTETFQTDGTVTINQGAIRYPGDNSDLLIRNYSVTYDKTNIYLAFIDYNYNALTYTLSGYNSSSMVLYVQGNGGAKLFSRFEKKPNHN